jgi:hypothetical protein
MEKWFISRSSRVAQKYKNPRLVFAYPTRRNLNLSGMTKRKGAGAIARDLEPGMLAQAMRSPALAGVRVIFREH